MPAVAERQHAPEGASEAAPHGHLAVHGVSESDARSDSLEPAVYKRAAVRSARAESAETQCAGEIVDRRIRAVRIEVRVPIVVHGRRRTQVPTDSEIDRQLPGDAPVVLRV